MALKCDFCKKGIGYGHNVSHSKRRTRRIFKPNLQNKKVLVDGRFENLKLCTKCIKLLSKQKKEKASLKSSEQIPDTRAQSL